MRYLVTGATGFIGLRLLKDLRAAGALSRSADRARQVLGADPDVFEWDPNAGPAPAEAFEGVGAVVHLAGEPIAGGRWTPERKARMYDSRIVGTRHLVDGMAALSERPKVLVSSSAVGVYGDRGDEVLTEDSTVADDFLAKLCVDWEKEAERARDLGVRVVQLRTGLVLGRDGGPLPRMLPPFQLGVGGKLGSGNQWMPWIHFDDVLGLIHFAANNESVDGPLNGSAPAPVTNSEFTTVLAKQLGRPALFTVPTFALKAMFGELADVLLASQRVEPRKALDQGYQFTYRKLDSALRAALGSASHSRAAVSHVP